ncbi:DUF397 domain-containing protein [Kitasatospora fiedleri]|uniref:DUF397 domain-containing protein n=1 Tax=Kitasatospora fiedleri TaxID=2991545 RepID=UPI00249A48E9|nr:DUF397 domain-containing protein [Kitasatospora fiedleri]
MHPDGTPENWVKSSYSNQDGGACVEVDANRPGTVRDSKDPDGPRLRFTPASWDAFVTAVVAGEFGHL